MLSVKSMTAEQAGSYHGGHKTNQDELYHRQDGELGVWRGELADVLCLQAGGEIDGEDYRRMLHQIHPLEDIFLVERMQKNAGFDCVFSICKTGSIAHELGDEVVTQAHQAGVAKVREIIERDFVGYKMVEEDGSRGTRNTGKCLFAEFQHDTSRSGDPDLHTHLFLHNLQKTESGHWRSLDAREIFAQEYMLGLVYRAEVAAYLQDHGRAIDITNQKEGFFELRLKNNIDRDGLIDHFSERGKQVKAAEADLREKLGRNLTKAEHDSCKTAGRTSKKKVDREELRANNIVRVTGFGEFIIAEHSQEMKAQITSREVVELSSLAMCENEAVFSKSEMLRQSLLLGIGHGITFDMVEAAARENDNLIFLENSKITTREMSEIESTILRDIEASRGQYKAVLEVDVAIQSINEASSIREIETGYALTDGQRATGSAILSNKSSILLVSGDAGSGKTTLLADVNRIAQESGRTIIGAAYTGSAAAEIEEASGIKSQTLHSLLLKKPEIPENSLIVVDEASMLGSRQFRELQKYADISHSQIVLIGDQKQMKGMSGGDLFSRLQEMPDKCQTAVMTESVRAQTSELKELYQLVKDRNFVASFEKMESRNEIIEASKEAAIKEIVSIYDDKTLVVADLNNDRMALNFAIREHLGFKGGKQIEITQNLTPIGVSRHFAQSYEVGYKISAERAFSGMKAGAVGIIKEIDNAQNRLIIKTADGKEKAIDLYKFGSKLTVTRQAQREFNVGEKVLFGKNNTKDLNVRNGQAGTIESISENLVKIKHDDGKVREVDINKYNYLDYGYARTVMASQGQSHSKVLGLLDPKVASSNSYYVSITRAMHSVKIWTNDLQKFKENVEKMQSKTSTIDYLSSWAASQKTQERGMKNGRGIIENLRAAIRSGRAKLDNFKADLRHIVSEARERWTAEFGRFAHEYRQSIKNDREQAQYHAIEHTRLASGSGLSARIEVAKSRGGIERCLEIGR